MIAKDGREIENPIRIWTLGNTGVRNPWRIQKGLRAYANSTIIGSIRGRKSEFELEKVLYRAGVIEKEKSSDASTGRKWRFAFNQFGFTYPKIEAKSGIGQAEIGPADCLTPMGRAFINAETVPSMQECYLRALTIPMEELADGSSFSPFCWSLAIMLKLEELTGSANIHFIEYAVCVQTSAPPDCIDAVAERILQIREARVKAENKRAFDSALIRDAWRRYPMKEGNFREYGDMNLRYMATSGIAGRVGRGIGISPEKKTVARILAKGVSSSEPLKERYKKLCQGAPLPTDHLDTANEVLNDLIGELKELGIAWEIPDIPLDTAANVNVVRGSLENRISIHKEEVFAARQRREWKEIYEYMKLLIVNNGREKALGDDYILKVPKSEAAAYLEWTLWRAFLAIDSLTNKPYEARRFKVDQDFLPVGTAAGGGPDMIFEFRKFIFVVEVTMSGGSRQEAMEGEPVRRHVADIVAERGGAKPVFGLFIANRVDLNTAETFRIGSWYGKDDRKMKLSITPFTLRQFADYFKAIFENNDARPERIIDLVNTCDKSRMLCEAPEWKKQIDASVKAAIAALYRGCG